MSNWKFLNKCRIKYHDHPYRSIDADGFNGMFMVPINGLLLKCIASDGMGWQHVSVSISNSIFPPSWAMMCAMKELFWEDEDCVIQFHPPKSQYVNNHPGCLHLWRCTDGREQPVPESIMVGFKQSELKGV